MSSADNSINLLPMATPQARRGPSSRLLQRQSLMLREADPETTDRTQVGHRHRQSDVTFDATSFSMLARTPASETKRLYNYQPSASVLAGPGSSEDYQATVDNLFVDFMTSCSSEDRDFIDVLDQVAEFEELLDEQIGFVRNVQSSISHADTRLQKVRENLMLERTTWRLVGKIFSSSTAILEMSGVEGMDDDKVSRPLTEQNVVENLFQRDTDLRRAQSVVDWLEMNARDDILTGQGPHAEALIGWENTLHTLMMNTNKNSTEHRMMVKEMDPDAKRRTGRRLHEVDTGDEQRLVKLIFLLIRAGMLERAQELCVEVGQPWRAATLIGWQLAHDPNLGEDSKVQEKLPMIGNTRRDIWKQCAWELSQDDAMPVQERVIYASLSGNSTQLLSSNVCRSWEDYVWALTRAMVDVIVEKEIRDLIVSKTYASLPEEYWDSRRSLREILQVVKSSEVAVIKEEMSSPFRMLQSQIILEDWDGMAQSITGWSQSVGDPHFLRFLAHLLMILKQLLPDDNDTRAKARVKVLEMYIQYLISSGRVRQVAWYTAQVPFEVEQAQLYARFLQTVDNEEDRKLCLQLGFEHALPMQTIRFSVVDNILEMGADDRLNEDSLDHFKIRAIDYLIFAPLEQEYALIKSNQLLRHFIAHHDLDKAKLVVEKVEKHLSPEDYDDDEQDHWRESNCLKLFVAAKEAFKEWFDFYHKGQPKKPEATGKLNITAPTESRDYKAKLLYEQRYKQYEEEVQSWHDALLVQSHEITTSLQSIINYPGGWLSFVHPLTENDANQRRMREADYLRSTCVVETFLLLHSIFHNTKQYQLAVRLADDLAGEENQLYSLFSKEDMRKMLLKFKESSVAMLEMDNRKDAWGYKKSVNTT